MEIFKLMVLDFIIDYTTDTKSLEVIEFLKDEDDYICICKDEDGNECTLADDGTGNIRFV